MMSIIYLETLNTEWSQTEPRDNRTVKYSMSQAIWTFYDILCFIKKSEHSVQQLRLNLHYTDREQPLV